MSEIKYVKDAPYGCENDYVAPDELTVTITLAEYRDLVGFKSKHNHELSNLKTENWRLEKEVEQMRKKICELVNKYATCSHTVNDTEELEREGEGTCLDY